VSNPVLDSEQKRSYVRSDNGISPGAAATARGADKED
jgi:hypothetical protein